MDYTILSVGSFTEHDTILLAGRTRGGHGGAGPEFVLRSGLDVYFDHVKIDARTPAPGGTEYVPSSAPSLSRR